MGIEAAPFLFGIPLVVCFAFLLVFALDEREGSKDEDQVLGLGRSRLAHGYLAALGVILVTCIIAAMPDGDLALVVYYFLPLGLLLVFLLTVLVLPIISVLRRFRYASVLGVTCTGVVLSIAIGQIIDGTIAASALFGAILALAFSIAAGLPKVRSAPMPANKPLQRSGSD